ncbi:MAG: phosphoglycolate phosphatase [Chlamydiae bacterium]|nr:MAG: phosphoglycolate phosphatase [Chlamydiota bacterium]
MYKGIIFDLDGTIIDTREDLALAMNLARKDYGFPALPVKQLASYVGNGAHKFVERSFANTEINIDNALQKYLKHYSEHLTDKTYCYDGAVETLEKLNASGVKCAVLTNKPEEPTLTILNEMNLTRFFDTIYGEDSTSFKKPDPGALLLIMEKWNIPKEDLLMVGDNYTDIHVAKNAGIKSAFFTFGYGVKDHIEPDYTFDNFSDLLNMKEINK